MAAARWTVRSMEGLNTSWWKRSTVACFFKHLGGPVIQVAMLPPLPCTSSPGLPGGIDLVVEPHAIVGKSVGCGWVGAVPDVPAGGRGRLGGPRLSACEARRGQCEEDEDK